MIDADLDLLFSFGASSVTAGAVSGLGLYMAPTEVIADGMVMSTDHEVTVKTSEFGNLEYGQGVVVDAVPYTLRQSMPIDDGRLTVLRLQRTVVESVLPAGPAVLDGDGVETESEVVLDGGTPGTVYIYDNVIDGGRP